MKGQALLGLSGNPAAQAKLTARYIPEPNSGCWIWTAAMKGRPGNSYPSVYWCGKYYSAHRISYAVFRGDIPAALDVCHSCDNTYCINPDHLFLGTERDNMRDMHAKGRAYRKGESHTRWQGGILTEALVIEIRRSSQPVRAFAREHGFSRGAVRGARFGKTWCHMNDQYPPRRPGEAS